jgi:hypothetical protein
LFRWTKYFSQLFNVSKFSDVSQGEIQPAAHIVTVQSTSEVDMVIEKLKTHKSPGIEQITAELVQAEGRKIRYDIQNL